MICPYFNLFLAQLCIGLISGAVYHIVPSPSHHCPVESCLTLSLFAANTSLYLDNDTSLIFQPGNHTMRSVVTVTNVAEFSMMTVANQSRAGISCENKMNPGFIFTAVNNIHVSNLKFFECYCDIDSSIGFANKFMSVIASRLVLIKSLFENNVRTGMIDATNSNITVAQCVFKDNNYVGSINNSKMFSCFSCNITIVRSAFIDNDGKLLFVTNDEMILSLTSTLTMISCEFKNNHHNFSQLIDVHNSDMILICDTNFTSNKMAKILYAEESIIKAVNCTFKYNHGSAMLLIKCKVHIFKSVFNNNEAYAALRLRNTMVHIHGSEFKENVNTGTYRNIGRGGAIYSLDKIIVSFSETCTFMGNQADQGGAIYLKRGSQCLIEEGATMVIVNNTASGGIWRGMYILSGNGGGIYFEHSNLTLKAQSTLQIAQNNASQNGGGIYLSYHSNIILHSQSTLQILENRATESGGGIYATASSINLHFKPLIDSSQTSDSTMFFYGNRASEGGGLYLGLIFNSTVHLFYATSIPCRSNAFIKFIQNSADYGGAVYASAKTSKTQYSDTECFFQSLQCKQEEKPFYFSLNRAKYSGISFYKGAFINCSMYGRSFGEFELLNLMSNIQTSDIGSALVQVCYCDSGLPDYSKQIPYVNIKTGDKLILLCGYC